MKEFVKRVAALRRLSPYILGIVLGSAILSGCMSAAPPMLNERTAVISARGTTGENARDAARTMLVKAAAMTVDHGFRYFRIVDSQSAGSSGGASIRPGADITIKVYREGEIDPRRPGVWDAENIAEDEASNVVSVSTPNASRRPVSPSTTASSSNPPRAHCTVYGCTWSSDSATPPGGNK
jgi:hypothetical protein